MAPLQVALPFMESPPNLLASSLGNGTLLLLSHLTLYYIHLLKLLPQGEGGPSLSHIRYPINTQMN